MNQANKHEIQKVWVKNQLLKRGFVSRNEALDNHISRLGAIIYTLKAQNPKWIIDAYYVKKAGGGQNYYYRLVNKKDLERKR